MITIVSIEKRIGEIKGELQKLGDLRPGSLSVQRRKGGGEYIQLSYTHRGKGHTEYVRKEREKDVQIQLEGYKTFRDLTLEWVDLAIQLCKLRSVEKRHQKAGRDTRGSGRVGRKELS